MSKDQVCPACKGRGTEADYVGLEMRCVETGCSRCNGTGRSALLPTPSSPEPREQDNGKP